MRGKRDKDKSTVAEELETVGFSINIIKERVVGSDFAERMAKEDFWIAAYKDKHLNKLEHASETSQYMYTSVLIRLFGWFHERYGKTLLNHLPPAGSFRTDLQAPDCVPDLQHFFK